MTPLDDDLREFRRREKAKDRRDGRELALWVLAAVAMSVLLMIFR